MSYSAAYKAIGERVQQVAGEVPVQHDNQDWDTPDGLWIRLHVTTGETRAHEFGGGVKYRTFGIAYATIMAPAAGGDADALALADTMVGAIRGTALNPGVRFKTPRVNPRGHTGGWWQIVVELPFHADWVING